MKKSMDVESYKQKADSEKPKPAAIKKPDPETNSTSGRHQYLLKFEEEHGQDLDGLNAARAEAAKRAELETIKVKLKEIFIHYTSFGDRMNTTNLKSQKFCKMMEDASIISGSVNKKQLDIIFCTVNQHKPNMSFNLYLETLTKVAILKYKTATPSDALQSLLSEVMVPLHTRIFGAVTDILDIQYDKMVALILSNASAILINIYCLFFQ
jgi:hypothetical protein